MSPLETLDHAPEPESLASGAFCVLLTEDQLAGTDDMADFTSKAKTILAAEFAGQGWSNTAAGELAEIHLGVIA